MKRKLGWSITMILFLAGNLAQAKGLHLHLHFGKVHLKGFHSGTVKSIKVK